MLIHQRRDEPDPLHLAAPHLLPQEVAHPHQDRGLQIRYHVSELKYKEFYEKPVLILSYPQQQYRINVFGTMLLSSHPSPPHYSGTLNLILLTEIESKPCD